MQTLTHKLKGYGIGKMADELGIAFSTVWRWAQAGYAPHWWHEALKTKLGRFVMEER